ncbi:GNAT family N-acetyltransferase [Flavobacterium saliperosum]|uniref:Acetyltransferase (GNAT) domain-containing protein n=2 Tax=Flavobacterium saliperosum TaxID=329186 RepID=A0A1G4VT15_9FLAO|nr:Acetyltransferase (GNAT) domain-containing protein [Flavobacterium saliperosum]
MEYHSDRFEDFSLLVLDGTKLVCVLPANRKGDEIFSHQGLTYGGFVTQEKLKSEAVSAVVDAVIAFLREQQFKNLFLKQLPTFYASGGKQQTDWFLFQRGAVLYRKDMNLAVNLNQPLTISKSKLKHFRRVSEFDLSYKQTDDFASFWNLVLLPRLSEKYDVKPVHSLEEIEKLQRIFPQQIKQFSVYHHDEIVAGITVFESDWVVKSQYGATTKLGEQLRALDYLFIHLLEHYQKRGKHFFDMGTVHENGGQNVNWGLLNQKEELGCSVYNQDFYTLEL